MSISENQTSNIFLQMSILLVIPFLTIFTIVNINNRMINRYYQLQLANKNKCLTKKITIILSFFGFFVMLQNFTCLMPFQLLTLHFNNYFLFQILPVISISAFFQLLLLLTFLSKDEEKINYWYNVRLTILGCLTATFIVQFFITIWEFRTWQFASPLNFLLLTSIYLSFITALSRNFASNLLVLNYLVRKTIQIIFQKQKATFVIKYEKYINHYSKRKIINYLWNFNQSVTAANFDQGQDTFDYEKATKLSLISLRNLLIKNCIKDQSIIVNGWKSILRI